MILRSSERRLRVGRRSVQGLRRDSRQGAARWVLKGLIVGKFRPLRAVGSVVSSPRSCGGGLACSGVGPTPTRVGVARRGSPCGPAAPRDQVLRSRLGSSRHSRAAPAGGERVGRCVPRLRVPGVRAPAWNRVLPAVEPVRKISGACSGRSTEDLGVSVPGASGAGSEHDRGEDWPVRRPQQRSELHKDLLAGWRRGAGDRYGRTPAPDQDLGKDLPGGVGVMFR